VQTRYWRGGDNVTQHGDGALDGTQLSRRGPGSQAESRGDEPVGRLAASREWRLFAMLNQWNPCGGSGKQSGAEDRAIGDGAPVV
jgi:hypothetical protein